MKFLANDEPRTRFPPPPPRAPRSPIHPQMLTAINALRNIVHSFLASVLSWRNHIIRDDKHLGLTTFMTYQITRYNVFGIVMDNLNIVTDSFRIATDFFFRSIEKLNDRLSTANESGALLPVQQ
jgi:hypothetical protein